MKTWKKVAAAIVVLCSRWGVPRLACDSERLQRPRNSLEDGGVRGNQGAGARGSSVLPQPQEPRFQFSGKTFVPAWSTLPITAFSATPTTAGDTSFGRNMYPKPPDMRAAETQNKTDGELFYTIYNGIRLSGMPAFGEKDQSDAESTWQLVRFIRHLSALTEEQEKQMEKLNPKSPMEESEEKQEEQFLKGGKPPMSMKMKHH